MYILHHPIRVVDAYTLYIFPSMNRKIVLPKHNTYVQLFYVSTYIFFTGVSTVAEIVMETYDSSGVLSWSPPNPPNGVILYCNIRTHLESGVLVANDDAFSNTIIDISDYCILRGRIKSAARAVFVIQYSYIDVRSNAVRPFCIAST